MYTDGALAVGLYVYVAAMLERAKHDVIQMRLNEGAVGFSG